jgi:pimeloyl-ACP methyl ester carboxylesterase
MITQPAGPRVQYRRTGVDGVNLFYREAGDRSRPAIVLLHGFPSSSHMYRELIPLLSDSFHVIAPDYPGFGHSDAPSPEKFNYTFENLAQFSDALLEQIGITKYYLYLQDYGGPVGFRIALKHPERVLGLVIQNANAYEEGLSDKLKASALPFWKERNATTEGAMREVLNLEFTKAQYTVGALDPAHVSPDAWTFDQALLDRPGNSAIQLALLYDYRGNPPLYPAWQAYLRKHQPKTLIVWGRGDFLFTPAGAEAFLRDLPKARLHWLEGGHFALEEHAPTIAKKIKEEFG